MDPSVAPVKNEVPRPREEPQRTIRFLQTDKNLDARGLLQAFGVQRGTSDSGQVRGRSEMTVAFAYVTEKNPGLSRKERRSEARRIMREKRKYERESAYAAG